MDFRSILESMLEARASDLHVKAGSRPQIRVDGFLVQMDHPPPSSKDIEAVVDQVLTPRQKEEFHSSREIDFAVSVPGLARFRANFYYQRGTPAMVLRHVPLGVPAFEDLNLPPSVERLALLPRGLVLITGTVGSGKSTTLASMIDCINRSMSRCIMTIEDPIEFLHRDDKSMISQREVGLDTDTYLHALKHVLRQDPDVILLGEIRDRDTMAIALMAADTGHLVLSTLHTVDAAQTVNRIISFYPPHQHQEIRFLLASTLQAIVSQRLIVTTCGKGRVPACEIMVKTPLVAEYLVEPEKTHLIKQAIQEGTSSHGMQSFDQSLMRFYREGRISLESAMENSSNPTEFALRIKGIHASSDTTWDAFDRENDGEGERATGTDGASACPFEDQHGKEPPLDGPANVSREPRQGPDGIVRY